MRALLTFFTIACYYCTVFSAPKSPLVITIQGITTSINNDEECSKKMWNNKANDGCECCLLSQQNASAGKKSADKIVETCIKEKKLCTEQSVASLKAAKKLPKASSEALLNALYDDIVVRPMTFDTSLLQSNGQFTDASLPQFLAQAYQEKKLLNPEFSKIDCLKAKNLGTQGGYNTLQLFLVTSTCSTSPASLFIVKEARDGIDEATRLKDVEKIDKMKDIIAPKVKPGLPTVALPFAFFSYPDKNAVHYIAAMPSAKGKPLSDLVMQFGSNQTPQNRELLNRAFQILGKETANFHKLFSKSGKGKILGDTIAHGDFHFFNLFFDEIAGHFTWIDNETMAKSIQNRVSPGVDVVKLFFMPFSINSTFAQFKDLITGIDQTTWCDIAVKNFALGYASAYPQNQQKQVFEELKKIFNDPFTIPWVDFDESELKEVRTKYINPVLDALIKK